MSERYVLLGVAPVRSDWFRQVGRWASTAALPAEFLRCASIDELLARLRTDRAYSAALVDARTSGFDRDVIAAATAAGTAVLVVDEVSSGRDWEALGAAAVLAPSFSRDELVEVLASTSALVSSATLDLDLSPRHASSEQGRLIAVTGPGGTGASVVAIALAQGLAERASPLTLADGSEPPQRRPSVLLADLCRVADQAMLHDAKVLVPGVQELVEAHRTSRPSTAALLEQTFDVPGRGYRLLLGLRRPRHWVALRQLAFESTLDSLQWLADVVVADLEADVEGEAESGSHDVQDRNLMARATLPRADLVLVVAEPSMKGLFALVRTLTELTAANIPPERLVPVFNRAPRSPRARAELSASLVELVQASAAVRTDQLAPPLFLPHRDLDAALRDGVALPGPAPRTLARAVAAIIARSAAVPPLVVPEPVVITPGSLSGFTAQDRPGA